MSRTYQNALAHHAFIASYGGDIGTRGPMLTQKDAPSWIVAFAFITACLFVGVLVVHGPAFASYLRSFV